MITCGFEVDTCDWENLSEDPIHKWERHTGAELAEQNKPGPAGDLGKVEKILKGSINLFPSPLPSFKIQIMGGKVCLRHKDKTLLIIFSEGEGDGMESKLSS